MDCCHVPAEATGEKRANGAGASDRCPRCGVKGRPVGRETLEALLTPPALARLTDGEHLFDRTPDCDVVYFAKASDAYFTTEDLTVRVGLEETEGPVSLCYCFGHTKESVREEFRRTGRTTVPERIRAEVRAGNCSCEVKNPSGACCLGEVTKAVAGIEEELEKDTHAVAANEER